MAHPLDRWAGGPSYSLRRGRDYTDRAMSCRLVLPVLCAAVGASCTLSPERDRERSGVSHYLVLDESEPFNAPLRAFLTRHPLP